VATALYLFWAVTWMAWVGLALAPSPEASPEWVLVARQVCFGSLPEGLPSASGWLMLAAPIPMLAVLIAICGQDLRCQWARLGRLTVSLLLLLPALTLGYAGWRVVQERPWSAPPVTALPPLTEDYPSLDLECPDFELKNQSGQSFTRENLKGEVTVLTFAYAHCQTVCPALLQTFRDFQGARKVVVTLDPWRDTCGNLSSIAKQWDLGEADVLSGAPEQVEVLTRAFNVPSDRDPKTGEITHPGLVFVLDREARVIYGFNLPNQDWLNTAVTRLKAR
jgi:cytochrome oxidase Cu insertion factor (SCO1/SenC/PrrC family)